MSECAFSFLLNMKVKSAPLQNGQNACAEKGDCLIHQAQERLLELLELHVLVLTGDFLPGDFKEAHLYLCK